MKVVCFIHSCTLPIYNTEKLDELLQRIKDSGCLKYIERIFINNIGTPIDPYKYETDSIKVINHSDDTKYFENCTLKMLYLYAQHNPDAKILYLHTKGVSHKRDTYCVPGIIDWTNFMIHSLVDHHADCIKLLEHVEMIGVNYRDTLYYTDKSHFSGNYWWTRADYFSTLNMHKFNEKYDAELEIMRNNPTFYNIHSTTRPWHQPYPLHEYKDAVTRSFIGANKLFSQQNEIYYGIEGNYTNITDAVKTKCVNAGIMHIPVRDNIRTRLFGDPLPGIKKHIKIGDLIFPESMAIRYPAYTIFSI